MGIEKIGLNAAKAVLKAGKTSVDKTLPKAISKLLPDFRTTSEVIEKLPKDACARSYSKETTEAIEKYRKNLYEQIKLQIKTEEKAKVLLENYDSFINEVLLYCPNEKLAKMILCSPKNICTYSANRNAVHAAFKNMFWTSKQDAMKFIFDMSACKMLAPQNYQKLQASKTIQEIAQGKLNPSYIAKAKTQEFLEENYIDKLLENITKTAQDRLNKQGINTNFITEYINFAKADIKRNPQNLERYLTAFERAENPELVNRLLSKFPPGDYFNYNNLSNLDYALNAPKEIVERVLKLKNLNPYMMKQYIEMFENKAGNLCVTDELFEYFLKFEEANPSPWSLKNFNNLIHYTNGDVTFAKEAFENISKQKDGASILFDLSENISTHNIDYAKHIIPKDWKITSEIQTKIYLSNNKIFKDPKNWGQIDTIYNETYMRLSKIFGNTAEGEYHAGRIAKLKIDNPELYKYLEDNHIIDLASQGKINPRILSSFGHQNLTKFRREIIEDAQKLSKGESLIKHFDTTKDIIKKTQSGDVISVQGKMYINNNGKLESWNMTEEKFNELFPLVDRFSTHQAIDNCYFIAPLNSLYENPKTRGAYYKLFEQKGEDIFVTIPAYKEYGGVIKFPKGEISTDMISGFTTDGAKHIQMIEQAYARSAFRKGDKISISQNPQQTTDLEFLNRRIRGGQPADVMREFQPVINYKATTNQIYINDKNREQVQNILEEYANNPKYIINEGFGTGKNTGHARHVKSYDKENGTVSIIDPQFSELEYQVPVSEFAKNLLRLIISRIG